MALRKTFKYKLKPAPELEREMAFVVRRCHELYNAALQERRDAWQKCGVGLTAANQSAQLPEVKDIPPKNRDIHSQTLNDELSLLDSEIQTFLRRWKAVE